MRSELFCKYQKNRDPRNFYYCTEPCITYIDTPDDHLPAERVRGFICPWLPPDEGWKKELGYTEKEWRDAMEKKIEEIKKDHSLNIIRE